MLVRKKILNPGKKFSKKFFPLIKKINNQHSKTFWKKIRARWKWTTPHHFSNGPPLSKLALACHDIRCDWSNNTHSCAKLKKCKQNMATMMYKNYWKRHLKESEKLPASCYFFCLMKTKRLGLRNVEKLLENGLSEWCLFNVLVILFGEELSPRDSFFVHTPQLIFQFLSWTISCSLWCFQFYWERFRFYWYFSYFLCFWGRFERSFYSHGKI